MEDNNLENQISEEEQVPITKKDPRRVEQGKRLAAISKEAKERKMRRKIMREFEEKKSTNYKWWVIGGISFFGILYLFYRNKEKNDYDDLEIVKIPEKKKDPEKKKTLSPKKENFIHFEEFD